MAENEQKEILEKAEADMINSLNSFGAHETLKSLVEFSKDVVVTELLTKFPGIVSVGDFLFKLPSFEVDEATFNNLVETYGTVWLKKAEKKEREDNSGTHPKIPKRRRIRKKKTQKAEPT